jgi:hypothetical protein
MAEISQSGLNGCAMEMPLQALLETHTALLPLIVVSGSAFA